MILKYKMHSKFYCVVYSVMIYLLYTNTRPWAACGTIGVFKDYVTWEESRSPSKRRSNYRAF
jgi:hypothetical protein